MSWSRQPSMLFRRHAASSQFSAGDCLVGFRCRDGQQTGTAGRLALRGQYPAYRPTRPPALAGMPAQTWSTGSSNTDDPIVRWLCGRATSLRDCAQSAPPTSRSLRDAFAAPRPWRPPESLPGWPCSAVGPTPTRPAPVLVQSHLHQFGHRGCQSDREPDRLERGRRPQARRPARHQRPQPRLRLRPR